MVVLYTRGETRTLFDTLQALLRLVGDVRNLEKDVLKVYVAVILFHTHDINSAKGLHFRVSET